MSNKKKLIVLSPHLDDAVLSCCDHLLHWIKDYQIQVISIFTAFPRIDYPQHTIDFMKRSGCTDSQNLEQTRKLEDSEAMQTIQISYQHLDFIEAGYRTMGGEPLYTSINEVYSGNLHDADKGLMYSLQTVLRVYLHNTDCVVMPYGVGKHIDHLLIRRVAETLTLAHQRRYYLDYPYALNLSSWTIPLLIKRICYPHSLLPMSQKKLQILKIYKSQYDQLFIKKPAYSEIILAS